MTTVPTLKLNSGTTIPQIGLGTWQMTDPREVDSAIQTALKVGYRHFDTAQAYHNEDFIRTALVKAGIKRKEIFITTKIATVNFLPTSVLPSFERSLQKLDTDYVDLLLLHFPVPALRRSAWKKLERLYKEGKAKAIGVSNYTIKHLEKLLAECEVKPAVNQVELHVFLQQPELAEFCNQQDIVVEAYSPLAHGHGMDDATLAAIAKKHGKTPAQIMLRWCVEQGWVVIPKSSHPKRIKENFEIFDFKLDKQDLADIKGLDSGLRTCWDPTNIP